MSSTALRSLLRRLQTRLGQRANRLVGQWVATPVPEGAPRIAQRVRQMLRRFGYKEQNYKICLLTEAQCRRAFAAYGPPSQTWAGVTMPAARLIAYQLRRNVLSPLRSGRQRWAQARRRGQQATAPASAGLFLGMNYQFCTAQDAYVAEPNRYTNITQETQRLLRSYQALSPTQYGQGTIGILISCYRPEPFIEDFLANLHELATPERLIPVVINAGMSAECEAAIHHSLSEGSFHNYHLLNRPGAGIYEAWNEGIQALGNNVEFITNFNVDDRRHPLCLNTQADCLNAFAAKHVAITDYCYFFQTRSHTQDLYAHNSRNTTLIPTVNQRTLLDRNFPHSSPLWRQSLHLEDNCGLFDTTYQSAGDAEFWYRVSRQYKNPFAVISIPLSLYYQNPKGLSTRPNTVGALEHQRCTEEHYNSIIEAVDRTVSPLFSEQHLQLKSPEHLQLHAYISALNQKGPGQILIEEDDS